MVKLCKLRDVFYGQPSSIFVTAGLVKLTLAWSILRFTPIWIDALDCEIGDLHQNVV
jgi:hypothetical protein